jgi:hypothetical protein
MKTVESFEKNCGFSTEDVRAELERLVDDPRFHGSERSRNILKYVVEKRIAGEQEA